MRFYVKPACETLQISLIVHHRDKQTWSKILQQKSSEDLIFVSKNTCSEKAFKENDIFNDDTRHCTKPHSAMKNPFE